jgi:CubicO group peptidase (beta-lactamase class C family)
MESIVDNVIQQFPSIPCIQIVIVHRSTTKLSKCYGFVDEQRQRTLEMDHWFDLASVSKLYVVTAFERLCEMGKIRLDDTVRSVLPEFQGRRTLEPYEDPLKPPPATVDVSSMSAQERSLATVDAGTITFRNLLAHNSGLPAWRPLFRLAKNEQEARQVVFNTFFSYLPGTRVVYSDLGLMLIGFAIERLSQKRLDDVVQELVLKPLALSHTRYLPVSKETVSAKKRKRKKKESD